MIIEQAKKVLKIEGESILALVDRIDDKFIEAVEILNACEGRVVVTGMGKSGLIGKKISSTLSSIGVPAFFLHPAEGIHGDLGMLAKRDVVIGLSNSGQTAELLNILPSIKRLGLKLISLTGGLDSPLAKKSDVVLDVSVAEEACPWDMVPTSSTTAALAMGDALAVALMHKKGVKPEDFSLLHPGGTLGKNILITVDDLMISSQDLPVVSPETPFKELVREITKKKKGVAIVVDQAGKLLGIVTDGDIRRLFGGELTDPTSLTAGDIMHKGPQTIEGDALAAKGLRLMEEFSITSLITIDKDGRPEGLIHLHDILKSGIV